MEKLYVIVEKNIQLNNKIYPYVIHYKKIKNCYVRVEKGQIQVSSSRYYSIETIEELIHKHEKTILQQIEGYQQKALYENDGFVYIFQKQYRLKVIDMNEFRCVRHGKDLYIYTRRVQECVEKYLKELLLEYIVAKVDEYLENDFHLPLPEIKIKKMKRRWGACFYTKNQLCFNLALVHIDLKLIDYVIVHELCHFIEANHSKAFYNEIRKRMPDYKEREKHLKEVGI